LGNNKLCGKSPIKRPHPPFGHLLQKRREVEKRSFVEECDANEVSHSFLAGTKKFFIMQIF
jgi:hypothetical protein